MWQAPVQEEGTSWSHYLSTLLLYGCALFSAAMAIARPVSSSVENLLDVGTINVLLPAILVKHIENHIFVG